MEPLGHLRIVGSAPRDPLLVTNSPRPTRQVLHRPTYEVVRRHVSRDRQHHQDSVGQPTCERLRTWRAVPVLSTCYPSAGAFFADGIVTRRKARGVLLDPGHPLPHGLDVFGFSTRARSAEMTVEFLAATSASQARLSHWARSGLARPLPRTPLPARGRRAAPRSSGS